MTDRTDEICPDTLKFTRAETRFLSAALQLGQLLEAKHNFNPNQPRVPKGVREGGQWRAGGGFQIPTGPQIMRAGSAAAARAENFLLEHHVAITRLLGGAQAVAGGAEAVGGVLLVTGGVTTSATGVGILVAGVGAWMSYNGYDNAQAGWNALITGEPTETGLHKALRQLGLTEGQASATEILLGGGASAAAVKMGGRALNKAVSAALSRRAAQIFDPDSAIDVLFEGRSLWTANSIVDRGLAWEAFDAARTGYRRLPANNPVFDQISNSGDILVSNKTLDLQRETYLRANRRALYTRLRTYIDAAATNSPRGSAVRASGAIRERRVHLLLRWGDAVPGQVMQIAAAERYAAESGVILRIDYAR